MRGLRQRGGSGTDGPVPGYDPVIEDLPRQREYRPAVVLTLARNMVARAIATGHLGLDLRLGSGAPVALGAIDFNARAK